MYFSPSTLGFYRDDLHGPRQIAFGDGFLPNPETKIPADAVAITDVQHAALLDAQGAGLMIESGPDGQPRAVPPPKPNFDVVRPGRLADVRAVREVIINRLMGIAARAQRRGEVELASACDSAAEALLAITKTDQTKAAHTLEGFDEAIMSQYREIADALPAAGRTAFKDLDL